MGAAIGGRVAEFLEMDRQELGEAVRGGASIAELAGDRVDGLVADLVARATERIEQAVADGRLDPERADGILARVEERITARLHEERPTGPAGS
jgi:molecular chaperone DnaK (HSP70)|tara:strand:- start:1949 stop:2230 length:282 start_codon:yes stop_codon:yes gene_type:complete